MITRNNDDYIASVKREVLNSFVMEGFILLHYYLWNKVDHKMINK